MTRRILILGAAGFIGRHATQALARSAGTQLILAGRNPATMSARLAPELHELPRRAVALHLLTEPDAWAEHLADVGVVLNCVGILRQRGAETYARVHQQAPAALAHACKARGIRLVHVSALGLTDSAKSQFLISKLDGERDIEAAGGDWVIARPSLLDGEGGYGAKWLRGVARLPIFVAPADANGKNCRATGHRIG